MKNELEDLTDDELYASYDAYKALIEAGLTKDQALSRTGLTAQIVKDFEDEEEGDDFKSDFEDQWESDEEVEGIWKAGDDDITEEDDQWSNDEELSDDFDQADYDERY